MSIKVRSLLLVPAALLVVGACTSAGGDGTSSAAEPEVSYQGGAHITKPAKGWFSSGCQMPAKLMKRIKRGYYPGRSPSLLYAANAPSQFPNNHSGPWDYLSRVPVVLYGPGYIKPRGEIEVGRDITVADLAPTFARLIGTGFPKDRAGRPLWEALEPAATRSSPPKLIVTVVWDGGGNSVLDAHPDSWPVLQELIDGGTSFARSNGGSSPSITPPIHATIGTGTFPNQHGVVDIKFMGDGRLVGAARDQSPASLLIKTFPEIYDMRTDNRAKVGVFAYKAWHEGMIGLGAATRGGDKDIAVLVDHDSKLMVNEKLYKYPSGLGSMKKLDARIDEVDASDGKNDGEWLGNDVLDDRDDVRKTPAWALYQTDLIKRLVRRTGFGKDAITDLFFTNYKQIDEVGHTWSMLGPEMEDVLAVTDGELDQLVRFLDRYVGKEQWVMAITADHGPAADLSAKGAWTIRLLPFIEDLAKNFGVTPEQLEIAHRVIGNWPRAETLRSKGISMGDIANFIIDYRVKHNADGDLPNRFESQKNDPVFATAFPASKLNKVWRCSRERSSN